MCKCAIQRLYSILSILSDEMDMDENNSFWTITKEWNLSVPEHLSMSLNTRLNYVAPQMKVNFYYFSAHVFTFLISRIRICNSSRLFLWSIFKIFLMILSEYWQKLYYFWTKNSAKYSYVSVASCFIVE